MKSGTGAGMETRAVAEIQTRTRIEAGTGTGTGSGRAQERQISAGNRSRLVDAISPLFYMRHNLCRPRVALAGT